MPAERNAFKLGLAIILFVTLFVGVVVFLAPRGGGDLRLRVRFPHDRLTTTLRVGSEVACGGQTVGSVRSLDLADMKDPQTGHENLFAVVGIQVDRSLGLRQDCRMVPEGPLLGGPGRLLILDRGLGRPVQDSEIVEGGRSQDLADLTRTLSAQLDPRDPASLLALLRAQLDAGAPDSLVRKLHASLDDLGTVTSRVRAELDSQQKDALISKLHGVLDQLNEATRLIKTQVDLQNSAGAIARLHGVLDTLHEGLGTLVTLLNENKQPMTEAIARVRNASQILEEQVATRLAAQLDPAQAAGLLAKVHVAIDRFEASLKDLSTITSNTRDIVLMNRENLNGMLANMKETSDHLKAASKEIRRNPWRLFYQPTLAEAERANVHDAARAFADAAAKLDDAVVRLQSLSQNGVQGVEARELKSLADQLNRTFEGFNRAESALWEQLKIK